MKKFKNKLSTSHWLISALLVIALVSSCKKTIDQSYVTLPSKITTKAAAKEYVNDKLTSYAKVLASLARNEKFRKAINEGVAKKI